MTSIVAIIGGKGGTGKTFIALNIAYLLRSMGAKVLLVDADVENPSIHTLTDTEILKVTVYKSFKPVVNEAKCSKCRLCIESCPEHSLIILPTGRIIHIESLCSGCGVCRLVCPSEAIEAGERVEGLFKYGTIKDNGIDILVGELLPNSRKSILLITRLIEDHKSLFSNYEYVIIDSPPGSSIGLYPIIKYASHIIIVTEPTPLSVNDLKKVLTLIDKYKMKTTKILIAINKYGIPGGSYDDLNNIINTRSIPHIKIPYSNLVVETYLQCKPLVKLHPESTVTSKLKEIVNFILT